MSWKTVAQKWAFAVVPAVGLLELALHVLQVRGGARATDWQEARDVVKTLARPDDLVLVAPRWLGPLGRHHLGSDLLTLEREARADETAFPRAIQVSDDTATAPELEGWKRTDERTTGRLTVTTFENPNPVRVLDRLLAHEGAEGMRVTRLEAGRETECPWSVGHTQAGSLGFGPAIPSAKFSCPDGGFVGVSIIATLDYTPRRCFYALPPSSSATLVVRFKDVAFGRVLHGHHGLYVEAERAKAGAPVTLAFSIDDDRLRTIVHEDGDGWKSFDIPTDAYAGKRRDLRLEIASVGQRRMYCFEAETR